MSKVFWAALFCACLLPGAARASSIIPTQYIVYKSGATSLPTSPLAAWEEPSEAYTAITVPLPFDALKAAGAEIASASAQIVMSANSPYAMTGAALMVCPAQSGAENGLVGCEALTYFAMNNQGNASYTAGCVVNPGGPTPCRADVTAGLQNLINAGTPLYLVGASYGNGSNGPLIWDLELLVNWEVP